MFKKIKIIAALGILTITLMLASCNQGVNKVETKASGQTAGGYQCPMKCTDKKFDTPGKCPECGMEMVKTE